MKPTSPNGSSEASADDLFASDGSGSSAESPSALIGRLTGTIISDRFRLVAPLARGGMSVLYKAEQIPLGRIVAVKIMASLPTAGEDAAMEQRFLLEAKTAAQLTHPNTIVVHDYGRATDGSYFIAMEYLHGRSLAHAIKEDGPFVPERAVDVGLQICGSLDEAHSMGLVHRDLKPLNVFLTRRGANHDFVKVLDFGLVKVLGGANQDNTGQTRSGMVMGTPAYMPPEQVLGRGVDLRSDIYAFGALMFHVLTGRPPFGAGSEFEVMSAHLHQPVPALREVHPECTASPGLEAVIRRCLAKDPQARFAAMAEVAEALHAFQGELPVASWANPARASSQRIAPIIAPINGEPRSNEPRPVSRELNSGEIETRLLGPEQPASQSGQETSQKTSQTGLVVELAADGPSEGEPSRWHRLRRPLIAGAAGLLAAGAIITVLAGRDDTGRPSAEPHASEPSAVQPAQVQQGDAPASAQAAPARVVEIVSTPAGAMVRGNGRDHGLTPVSVQVPVNERWSFQIAKQGYQERTVSVEPGQSRLDVQLMPDEPNSQSASQSASQAVGQPAGQAALQPQSATSDRRKPRDRRTKDEPRPAGDGHAPAAPSVSGSPAAEQRPVQPAEPDQAKHQDDDWQRKPRTENPDPWDD